MKKFVVLFLGILLTGVVTIAVSCMDREPAPVCPVPLELNRTKRQVSGFEGVDMLVVVDNSSSMAEEQAILSTQFFTLVNSLVFPTINWQYPPAPSVRIGIVSSDMGQQFNGGGDGEYEDLELGSCHKRGDNGKFQTYDSGKRIDIREGEIKCNLVGQETQCPDGWECRNQGNCEGTTPHDDVGCCYDGSGNNGQNQECPGLNAIYAETPLGSGADQETNWDLAFQASCLADLGIDGCGFEQQLQAAAKGLIHPDNNPDSDKTFYRDNFLLAVLIVTDEEDCSIEDGDLFKSDDLLGNHDPHRMNVACGGENAKFLYTPKYFKDWFVKYKKNDFSTVFAAIVGVPPSVGDDNTCEGRGPELKDCLERSEMEEVEITEIDSNDNEFIAYRAACTREDNGTLVTKARPGKRYVELAQEFGNFSYVSSICNADWSPAMSEIASLIAKQLQGTCYPKSLEWDPEEKRAKCDVVVEYIDQENCAFDLAEGDESYTAEEVIGDVTTTILYCPLPRLPASLDCAQAEQDIADLADDTIGWYYCEDNRENFEQACDPNGAWAGIDEDGDGDVDCDDQECWRCKACEGIDGINPSLAPDCLPSCKFKVELTAEAKRVAKNHSISVQCLQQVTFTDTNCQENTEDACNDGKDNDGSGVADCMSSEEYLADRNCCPMIVDEETQNCLINSAVNDICSEGAASDACALAAKALKCNL